MAVTHLSFHVYYKEYNCRENCIIDLSSSSKEIASENDGDENEIKIFASNNTTKKTCKCRENSE